ncbi:hypothetical protein GOP47_0017404 [Adiantum capillus-veneris]|uniref:Uncharacterized protein n=1 Tax=Adiantum capillus-veneris TaxID=13818 RepID=A0A9D4UF99_ADICA|nr:hypothetical protein GOP47_0017404 [Adiantum capillus-veneris]
MEVETMNKGTNKEEDVCDDALTILAAIEEMNQFNSTHEGAKFQLVEATLNGYKDKSIVKLECQYDGKWLHLCPRGSDLQTILTQHIQAKSHITAWSKKPSDHSSMFLSGTRGRPKKLPGKDARQQSLSSFLTQCKGQPPNASDYPFWILIVQGKHFVERQGSKNMGNTSKGNYGYSSFFTQKTCMNLSVSVKITPTL